MDKYDDIDPCDICESDHGGKCLLGTRVCTIEAGNRPCEADRSLACDACDKSTFFGCLIGRC